ncbi:DUF7109 family protein [Haloarchaeobius sp. DFWS5]|uniref:DUF7109 family protein n=1 Tax=Haloarchaeobius sp. DFWS5 TaxID=3446114 RepID=UPI003EBB8A18
MRVSEDELAGVVDLFGGLTRDELTQALTEVAYRAGDDIEEETVESAISGALASYHLVEYCDDDRTLIVAGPRAFPEQPDHAEDLPHIMGIDPRDVDRQSLGTLVRQRMGDEASAALAGANEDRMHELVDVSYDLEAWAPVDCTAVRSRIDARL